MEGPQEPMTELERAKKNRSQTHYRGSIYKPHQGSREQLRRQRQLEAQRLKEQSRKDSE